MEKHNQMNGHAAGSHGSPYYKLAVMVVLSFIAMYVLMYSMVDRFANVIPNVNQFYMAGLMAMPMLIIELLIMWSMYGNKKINILLLAVSTIALLAFYFAIRKQAAVSDKQFLKSMIPHHAAAILMVEEAELHDPEVQALGRAIIEAQQKEIQRMKNKIEELESK